MRQGQIAGWGQLMGRLAPSMFGGSGALQDLFGGPQQQQDPFGRAGGRSEPHHTSPGFGGGQFGIPNADDWNSGRGLPEWWTGGGSPNIPGVRDLPDPGTGIGEVQRMGLPFGKSIDPRWASIIAAGAGGVLGHLGESKEQELERQRYELELRKYEEGMSQSPWAGHFASAMMGLEPSNLTQSAQPTLQTDLQDLSGEGRERSERFRYGGQFRREYPDREYQRYRSTGSRA
jgi:hypothetical protein